MSLAHRETHTYREVSFASKKLKSYYVCKLGLQPICKNLVNMISEILEWISFQFSNLTKSNFCVKLLNSNFDLELYSKNYMSIIWNFWYDIHVLHIISLNLKCWLKNYIIIMLVVEFSKMIIQIFPLIVIIWIIIIEKTSQLTIITHSHTHTHTYIIYIQVMYRIIHCKNEK